MAFWDASAIVPLCCSQAASVQGRQLRRDLKRMVVWWGTPLEARSAFARLVRDGNISPDEHVAAVNLLGQLRATWDEILPTEKLRSLAEELPEGRRRWRQARRSCVFRSTPTRMVASSSRAAVSV